MDRSDPVGHAVDADAKSNKDTQSDCATRIKHLDDLGGLFK